MLQPVGTGFVSHEGSLQKTTAGVDTGIVSMKGFTPFRTVDDFVAVEAHDSTEFNVFHDRTHNRFNLNHLQATKSHRIQQALESGSGPGGRRFKSSLPDHSFSISHSSAGRPTGISPGALPVDTAKTMALSESLSAGTVSKSTQPFDAASGPHYRLPPLPARRSKLQWLPTSPFMDSFRFADHPARIVASAGT